MCSGDGEAGFGVSLDLAAARTNLKLFRSDALSVKRNLKRPLIVVKGRRLRGAFTTNGAADDEEQNGAAGPAKSS